MPAPPAAGHGYACDNDLDVVRTLPPHVQAAYPFPYQSPNAGITPAASLLCSNMTLNGTPASHVVGILNESKARAKAEAQRANFHRIRGAKQYIGLEVEAFPNAISGPKMTTDIAGNAAAEQHAPQVQVSHDRVASRGGQILSIDAGVKLAKLVKGPGGSRSVTAVHVLMNEHKEIVGWWAGSNSAKALAPGILRLYKRLERLDPDRKKLYGRILYR
jgi:hypothetical protein